MKLLIVDDHPVMRFGVRQLVVQRWPDAVIGEASCLTQALEQVRAADWELVVLDLSMPDTSGLEGLVRLHRAAPHTRMLVLSMHDEAAYAARALQLGAAGYLTKEHATTELVAAIEARARRPALHQLRSRRPPGGPALRRGRRRAHRMRPCRRRNTACCC